MAIKAIIKTLEEVDEKYRDLYTQRGEQYELTGVEGMKTEADVQRVQVALTKERGDHALVKQKLTAFTALGDLETIQGQLARIPELELMAEGKGVDDKKIDKLVEARIAQKIAPVERERDQLEMQLGEKDKVINDYTTKERTRTIHDAIRAAAVKVKVEPTALEDALLLGERHLDVDAAGQVVTKDGVGVTPGVGPEVWFTDMQSKRPHWWGPSAGGGAGGSNNGAPPAKNPFTREHWNMTEQGQLVRADRAKAEQMAKAAGTTIGGGMPPPKA